MSSVSSTESVVPTELEPGVTDRFPVSQSATPGPSRAGLQGRISEDLMVAERELYGLRLNRLEFEDALEMAKAISLDAVRFWEATPTTLVDTFLSTLFPDGLVASGGRVSNPVSTRFFLGLQTETADSKDLVARTGFEPVLPA